MGSQKSISGAVLLLLVLSLVVPVVAGPPTVLIKVLGGQALLEGKPISKAQMAGDGQVLRLEQGAAVYLKSLDSDRELKVEGPAQVVIDSAKIKEGGQTVSRGDVSFLKDFGNKNVAAGIRRRNLVPDVNLTPLLPPILDPQRDVYTIIFGESADLGKANVKVAWRIVELVGDSETEVTSDWITGELKPVEINREDLQPGKRYQLQIDAAGSNKTIPADAAYFFTQNFRLLEPQAEANLKAVEFRCYDAAEREDSVLPLLELAEVYADLDRQRELYVLLANICENRFFKDCDQETQEILQMSAERLRLDILMPLRKIPTD